jgi:hypothetical protein
VATALGVDGFLWLADLAKRKVGLRKPASHRGGKALSVEIVIAAQPANSGRKTPFRAREKGFFPN